METVLDTIDNEKYINILTIVNYRTKNIKKINIKKDSLFEKITKKFKNANSQILFLGSSFNFDYLSLTQF